MPANDSVRIDYEVTGTDAAAKQIDTVNKSLEKTGGAAESAGKGAGDVGSGISGLGAILGQVNPQLGTAVSTLEAAKFASQGLGGGLQNLVAGGKSLLGLLTNPAFLAVGVTIGAITYAYQRWAQAQEAVTQNQRDINAELERQAKLVDDQRLAAGTEGRTIQADVAQRLAAGGAPAALADDLLKEVEIALRDKSTLGLTPQSLIDVAVQSTVQTGQTPGPVQISLLANAIKEAANAPILQGISKLPEGEIRDAQQFNAISQLATQEDVRRKAIARANSLAGDEATTQQRIQQINDFTRQRESAIPGLSEAITERQAAKQSADQIRESLQRFGFDETDFQPGTFELREATRITRGQETVPDLMQAGEIALRRIEQASERIRALKAEAEGIFGGFGTAAPVTVINNYGPSDHHHGAGGAFNGGGRSTSPRRRAIE